MPYYSTVNKGLNKPVNLDEAYKPTLWESFLNSVEEGWESGPFKSSLRAMTREHFSRFPDMNEEELIDYAREWGRFNPGMDLREQEKRINEAGLSGKVRADPVYDEETLDVIITARKASENRKWFSEQAPAWHKPFEIAGEIAGASIDPIEMASVFVPVVGEQRKLEMLSRATGKAGRALARAKTGLIEGAVGSLASESITLSGQSLSQQEYGPLQSLMNIAGGAVLGAALHPLAGAVSEFRHRNDWIKPWEAIRPNEESSSLVAKHAEAMTQARLAANPDLDPAAIKNESMANALMYDLFARSRAWHERKNLTDIYDEWTLDYKSGEVVARGVGDDSGQTWNYGKLTDLLELDRLPEPPKKQKPQPPTDPASSPAENMKAPQNAPANPSPEVQADLANAVPENTRNRQDTLADPTSPESLTDPANPSPETPANPSPETPANPSPEAPANPVQVGPETQNVAAATPREASPAPGQTASPAASNLTQTPSASPPATKAPANAAQAPGAAISFYERQRAVVEFFQADSPGQASSSLLHIIRRQLAEAAQKPDANPRARQIYADLEDACNVKDGIWTRENEDLFVKKASDYFWRGKIADASAAPALNLIRNELAQIYGDFTERGLAASPQVQKAIANIFQASPEEHDRQFRLALARLITSDDNRNIKPAPPPQSASLDNLPDPSLASVDDLKAMVSDLNSRMEQASQQLEKLKASGQNPKATQELLDELGQSKKDLKAQLDQADLLQQYAACVIS